MSNDVKYNFEEFSTFLLIHASYADLEFTEDEKAKILERISQQGFEKVHEDYNKMNEGEILQCILSYKGVHYPTPARRMEILSIIREQFGADGNFSRLEKSMMQFLERIL